MDDSNKQNGSMLQNNMSIKYSQIIFRITYNLVHKASLHFQLWWYQPNDIFAILALSNIEVCWERVQVIHVYIPMTLHPVGACQEIYMCSLYQVPSTHEVDCWLVWKTLYKQYFFKQYRIKNIKISIHVNLYIFFFVVVVVNLGCCQSWTHKTRVSVNLKALRF